MNGSLEAAARAICEFRGDGAAHPPHLRRERGYCSFCRELARVALDAANEVGADSVIRAIDKYDADCVRDLEDAGFTLDADGAAAFSNLVVRGQLTKSDTP